MKIFRWIKIMWRKRKLEKLGLDFSNIWIVFSLIIIYMSIAGEG